MPNHRFEQRCTQPNVRSQPIEPPYPDWATIRAKITPGMLGPRPRPSQGDWTEIADDHADEPVGSRVPSGSR